MNQYPVSRWHMDSQGKSAYSSFTDYSSFEETDGNCNFEFGRTVSPEVRDDRTIMSGRNVHKRHTRGYASQLANVR